MKFENQTSDSKNLNIEIESYKDKIIKELLDGNEVTLKNTVIGLKVISSKIKTVR